MSRIVIIGNCMIGPLAASLALMTKNCHIKPCPIPDNIQTDDFKLKLDDILKDSDICIAQITNSLVHDFISSFVDERHKHLQTCYFPTTYFRAFHPDICYAWDITTEKFTRSHYNSAIVVWSYRMGLSENDTVRLFREEVFQTLGYFDLWDFEIDRLRQEFLKSDLSQRFSDFFLFVQRYGCFMHTYDHPKVIVSTHIARLIAENLGLSIVREINDGEVADTLNGWVWPLYPEIAHVLGLATPGYHWKFIANNFFIDSLEEFIRFSYDSYRKQGIDKDNLHITFQDSSHLNCLEGFL